MNEKNFKLYSNIVNKYKNNELVINFKSFEIQDKVYFNNKLTRSNLGTIVFNKLEKKLSLNVNIFTKTNPILEIKTIYDISNNKITGEFFVKNKIDISDISKYGDFIFEDFKKSFYNIGEIIMFQENTGDLLKYLNNMYSILDQRFKYTCNKKPIKKILSKNLIDTLNYRLNY